MVGRIDIIVPVCGEIVIVAGETIKLLFSSKMTAREDTRTVSGMLKSPGGVYAGVGYEKVGEGIWPSMRVIVNVLSSDFQTQIQRREFERIE